MSRENIFEGKEEKKQPLEMPERRDFFDASHATQPLIRPERRKSLVISEGSNTSVLPPSEELQKSSQPLKRPKRRSSADVSGAVSKFLISARKASPQQLGLMTQAISASP
jgi:hypothetical protein